MKYSNNFDKEQARRTWGGSKAALYLYDNSTEHEKKKIGKLLKRFSIDLKNLHIITDNHSKNRLTKMLLTEALFSITKLNLKELNKSLLINVVKTKIKESKII